MVRTIIAQRYAKGLFAAGKDEGRYKEFGEELEKLSRFLRKERKIQEVLESPIYPPDLKMEIVEDLIRGLGLEDSVAKFLRLLVEKGRIHFISDILEAYKAFLDEEMGIARAEVYVAQDLDPELKKALAEALGKKVHKKVVLKIIKDPSLLGGIKAKIGDLVLDGSIRTYLEKCKESIIRGDEV